MKRSVFITGGTGLVGGGVVQYFLESDWDVVMATSSHGLKPGHPRLRIVPFDLEAPLTAEIRDALTGCDAVVHAGAVMPHQGDGNDAAFARRLVTANAFGTFELLGLAEECGVSQAISIGRTAGYYRPDVPEILEGAPPSARDPYGLSKEMCEQVVDYFDRRGVLRAATLRISAPYGPGSRARSVIPLYVEWALAGKDLEIWGSGARAQTFTHVRDIARACLLGIQRNASGQFNIAGSRAVSMKELAETVVRAAGAKEARVVLGTRADPDETVRIRVSIDKARAELGYAPVVELEQGIGELIAYARTGGRRSWLSTGAATPEVASR